MTRLQGRQIQYWTIMHDPRTPKLYREGKATFGSYEITGMVKNGMLEGVTLRDPDGKLWRVERCAKIEIEE